MGAKRFVDWSFDHYLQIAPPSFASDAPAPRPGPTPEQRRPLARAA
jgi:hypothetical protein